MACSPNAADHPALCGAGIGSTVAPGAVAATTAPQPVRPFPLPLRRFFGHAPYEPQGSHSQAAAVGSRSAAAARHRGRLRRRAAFPGLQPSVRRRSRCKPTMSLRQRTRVCRLHADMRKGRVRAVGGWCYDLCRTTCGMYTQLPLRLRMQHDRSAVSIHSASWCSRANTGMGSQQKSLLQRLISMPSSYARTLVV